MPEHAPKGHCPGNCVSHPSHRGYSPHCSFDSGNALDLFGSAGKAVAVKPARGPSAGGTAREFRRQDQLAIPGFTKDPGDEAGQFFPEG